MLHASQRSASVSSLNAVYAAATVGLVTAYRQCDQQQLL